MRRTLSAQPSLMSKWPGLQWKSGPVRAYGYLSRGVVFGRMPKFRCWDCALSRLIFGDSVKLQKGSPKTSSEPVIAMRRTGEIRLNYITFGEGEAK